jgi:hypothetical protein
MNKFKIGDVVKAIDNNYTFTNKALGWTGKVTKVREDGYFYADTISSEIKSDVGVSYGFLSPEHFALVKKELEDVEVGDILVDDEGKDRYVMAVNGRLVDLADYGYEADDSSQTMYYTMLELKKKGFTFKDQEPEIMEISMDDVAKKFGKSASEIRIKKE